MIGLLIAQAAMLALGVWASLAFRRAASAPQPPAFWLLLIMASLIPTCAAGLVFFRPDTGLIFVTAMPDAMQTAAAQSRSVDILIRVDLPWALIYVSIAGLIFARHLIRLTRLHRLRAAPHADHADLYLSDTALPPLALGWPRKRIVVSSALWTQLEPRDQAMLLAHERCHLSHRDPDMTLALLALQSLFWINPGFRALVTGWREAIERRADAAAIRTHNRRDYAKLFTRLARTAANLPVPTQSKPRNQGDLIMRLHTILKADTRPAPKRSLVLIAALSLTASLGVSIAGAASPDAEPDIMKRVPPAMPATCPGLSPETIGKIRILADEVTQKDDETWTKNGTITVGKVNLRYDVGADGVPSNITVTSANAPCFRAPSIAAIADWRYVANQSAANVETQIQYQLAIKDGDTVRDTLDAFKGAPFWKTPS